MKKMLIALTCVLGVTPIAHGSEGGIFIPSLMMIPVVITDAGQLAKADVQASEPVPADAGPMSKNNDMVVKKLKGCVLFFEPELLAGTGRYNVKNSQMICPNTDGSSTVVELSGYFVGDRQLVGLKKVASGEKAVFVLDKSVEF